MGKRQDELEQKYGISIDFDFENMCFKDGTQSMIPNKQYRLSDSIELIELLSNEMMLYDINNHSYETLSKIYLQLIDKFLENERKQIR